jgi:tetratricopeptide (TPR) repeat protein
MRDDPGDQRAQLDHAVARLRLGRAEAGMGQLAKAREHFDIAAREAGALAFPGPHANALRAQAEAIRRAMRAAQDLNEPARVLQYCDALSAMLPPPEAEEHDTIRSLRADNTVIEADALAWCGELDRAERLLSRAEQLDPGTSPEKTITTAALLLARAQKADAREAAQAALDLITASATTPGRVNSERDYWIGRAARIIEAAGVSAAP